MAVASPDQGELSRYFYQYASATMGEPPPARITVYVRNQCSTLLGNGNSPRVIKRAIELMVRRRQHPRLLPFFVMDAINGKTACVWQKHPNKFMLTPTQLQECGCADCLETVPYSEVA